MDPNFDYEWELFCNGTWTCYDFMTAVMLQGASRHEAECFFEARWGTHINHCPDKAKPNPYSETYLADSHWHWLTTLRRQPGPTPPPPSVAPLQVRRKPRSVIKPLKVKHC